MSYLGFSITKLNIFFSQHLFHTELSTHISWVIALDVVTLRDQMMRVARFSCGVLGDKAGTKNQGAYI